MRDLQIDGLPCKLVKPVRLLMKETDVSISTPKNAREKAPPKRGQVAWGMRAKGLSSTSTQFGARATVPVTVTRNSDCDFAATESVAYQLAASFHPLMSRINIFWAVIAILLVLLAVTRYVMHEKEISHICADDPSAPECQR